MNRWFARLLALVLTAAAIYLVYANVHAPSILLECTLAAAVLAIATLLLAWKRPVAAAVLNVVWLAGAFVASASLSPNRELPNLTTVLPEISQPAAGAAATSAPAVASDAWQTSDPSQRAANEQVVPTAVLGTDQVDDGIVEEAYAQKTVKAVSAAAAAFGTAAPSSPDPKVQTLRRLEAAIPPSEYNLDRLADTLPADPVAIYRFVRDNVGTDVYAGSMRGPLGAWMGRAANSADKARLLAWLLAKKNIAARFERGTLSSSERSEVVQQAAAAQRVIVPLKDGIAARYTTTRAAAGAAFAAWAISKLQAVNVAVAISPIDASQVPAQHYWIRVYDRGKQIDLDPTLRSTPEGRHLGIADPTFKERATFPDDDTMHVRLRLVARNGGTQTILAEAVAAVPDVAYSPLIVGITPEDANAQMLETAIVLGPAVTNGKPIATTQLPDSLLLQIDRATGSGPRSSIARTIFNRSVAASNAAQGLTGIHTVVLAPGSAPMFFVYETLRDARVLAENNAARTSGAAEPNHGLYPSLLAAFFMRDDALAATLGDRNGLRLFRDRPDVVMLHTTLAGNDPSGATYRTVFDIADNGMNAVAAPAALAAANLARGWGDTWIERDLLQNGGSGAMTAWLANKKSTSYTVVKSGSDNLSPRDVALTAAGGQPQWWDIDPLTASVVGRLPGGWGVELSESTVLLRRMQLAYQAFEINEADEECAKGGPDCEADICKLTISGIPMVISVGEAEIKAAAFVIEAMSAKVIGEAGCGGLEHGHPEPPEPPDPSDPDPNDGAGE